MITILLSALILVIIGCSPFLQKIIGWAILLSTLLVLFVGYVLLLVVIFAK